VPPAHAIPYGIGGPCGVIAARLCRRRAVLLLLLEFHRTFFNYIIVRYLTTLSLTRIVQHPWWMSVVELCLENGSTLRTPVSLPLCLPKISCGLAWDGIRIYEVSDRHLTFWAMARP